MSEEVARVERLMREVVESAERASAELFARRGLPLYGVVRYHLGWADQAFRPVSVAAGKRIRPLVCLLSCAAAGGEPETAVPTAAAIELVHNFTLVHDDVQDRSLTRRYRPTVWSLWGEAQAINVGDAIFALSQLALLDSARRGVPADRTIEVARALNAATLRIVEGQVLDLSFEERWDLTVDDYLQMIGGKTAAILAFAAWAGAYLAGAPADRAEDFRAFGRALGLGFQIRDDLLGIWGEPEVTGKPAADDIRRRKKSFPIVALASAASPEEREELRAIYARPELSEEDVARVLQLLERHRAADSTQAAVDRFHDEARALLERAAPPSEARAALESLLERLATRVF